MSYSKKPVAERKTRDQQCFTQDIGENDVEMEARPRSIRISNDSKPKIRNMFNLGFWEESEDSEIDELDMEVASDEALMNLRLRQMRLIVDNCQSNAATQTDEDMESYNRPISPILKNNLK